MSFTFVRFQIFQVEVQNCLIFTLAFSQSQKKELISRSSRVSTNQPMSAVKFGDLPAIELFYLSISVPIVDC